MGVKKMLTQIGWVIMALVYSLGMLTSAAAGHEMHSTGHGRYAVAIWCIFAMFLWLMVRHLIKLKQ